MHSDWFNGIEILQGRRQHEEKVGYCYPSGLEKTLCKWDINVSLVTKGLKTGTGFSKNLLRLRSHEYLIKVKQFHYRPGLALGVPGG
jgi:hypothetical protein